MDSLFPKLPKDLSVLEAKEVSDLLAEHESAFGLWKADDPEFLAGLSADEVLAEGRVGAEQIKALNAELEGRAEAQENYVSAKAEIADGVSTPKAEEEPADDDTEDGDEADKPAAVAETTEPDGDEPEPEGDEAEKVDERVLVTADAGTATASNIQNSTTLNVRYARTAPPAPAEDRIVVSEPETKQLAFVASGLLPITPPGKELIDSQALALALIEKGKDLGSPSKSSQGREERFRVATLNYSDNFPEERTLRVNAATANGEKLKAAGSPFGGQDEFAALTASGGLCAPAENIYTMPNLASTDRPVWNSLPVFRAERGAINVPVPTTIGDAAGAITVITAAEDGLGGTFATKACLDLDCPDFNETAVTVIAHCREFGNLNAFSWPEKIAHENEITMAEWSRVAEGFILGQIKAQSVHVSSGAETLSALTYLMDAITKSQFGIRSRLRLPNEARFEALLPRVVLDILLLDTVQKQFDSYRTRGDIEGYLASVGVDVTWYMDTPLLSNGVGTDGPSMIADAAQGDQAALEGFPDTIQWGLYPAGTFLGIDMAELNLGIVRDSTLNSTNDFQIFGEGFINVARIGPPQAAYWETTDICATGQYPPLGTARTCD